MNHPHQQRSWSAPKTVALPDFLTEAQLSRAQQCQSAKEIAEKVIEPNLAEINRKLAQENDAMYLAHACEMVFRQAGIWR